MVALLGDPASQVVDKFCNLTCRIGNFGQAVVAIVFIQRRATIWVDHGRSVSIQVVAVLDGFSPVVDGFTGQAIQIVVSKSYAYMIVGALDEIAVEIVHKIVGIPQIRFSDQSVQCVVCIFGCVAIGICRGRCEFKGCQRWYCACWD